MKKRSGHINGVAGGCASASSGGVWGVLRHPAFICGVIAIWAQVFPLQAGTVTWNGSVNGDWGNLNNWSPAAVPANGDDVIINSSAAPKTNVVLSSSTFALSSLTLSNAVLTFTNWTTTLNATNVVVQDNGIMTLPAAFTNGGISNRVSIACLNFTLYTNAVIYAKEKGWAGSNGPGVSASILAGNFYSSSGGGGYGGKGGQGNNYMWTGGPAYGSTNAPVDPGSGGGASLYVDAGPCAGGGAVRINAGGGTVTIHGTINADGGTHPTKSWYNGGGSGGAIYITCGTFQGSTNGLLSVNGGSGNTNANDLINVGSGAGGGGRIAVNYTSVGAAHGVRFSASNGWSWAEQDWPQTRIDDRWWAAPEPGALWLPDAALLSSTLVDRQFIRPRVFINGGAWSVGSLTISNCALTFADGFQLTVTNTLRIDSGGALGIGTLLGNTNPAMTCGSLVLTNGGTLTVYSGTTNGLAQDYGALVTVAGDAAIGAGSWITPYSNSTNGSSVLFRMTNLRIDAGGGFNAHGRGYAWAQGPGKGTTSGDRGAGGGYGGKGGAGNSYSLLGGVSYGQTDAPIVPGSGGCYSPYDKGYGGGCIRVEVAASAIINGTMNADGASPRHYYPGAGSGGGIYLICATFGGTTNGILKADGGSAAPTETAGGGGGGRIAVRYQNLASPHATRFSTAAGTGWANYDIDNRWWAGADRGTVWLSDSNLLSSTLADGLFNEARLFVPGFTAWTVAGLTVSNCSVFFEDPSLRLTVNGDLAIYGGGKLGVYALKCTGNIVLTNGGGLAVTDLDGGGNLTLANSNSLSVYSGPTNVISTNYGALVRISGDLTTARGSWIYPYSQATNGGSPLFRVRNLIIATNSGFNANNRGYGIGKGPGKGSAASDRGGGSGYGGKGGSGNQAGTTGGSTYGSSNAPLAPGSGMDSAYGAAYGGGLVRVEADQGIVVNGTITAKGGNPMHPYGGAGSGGGIYLTCATFGGAANGILNADGGTTPGAAGAQGGGGGGGRIAVWYGVAEWRVARILAGNMARVEMTNSYAGFLGTVSVTNGAGYPIAPPDYSYPGTIVFLTVIEPPEGTVLRIF